MLMYKIESLYDISKESFNSNLKPVPFLKKIKKSPKLRRLMF